MATIFNEDNTIEQMMLSTLQKNGWKYIPAEELPRMYSDVLVEPMVKEALIRLNPEIAEDPSRADEVIYKLRTLILSVQPHNLVTQNEIFKKMIFEENSYPFGKDGRMVPIRFFGTMRKEDLALNEYVVTNQWIYPQAEGGKRLDIVLLINGFPIAIGELKTPVRSAITWLDAAGDISAYEKSIPAMFVTNVFNFATEGKCYRYGSINMPINMWGPWHTATHKSEGSLADVKISVEDMISPKNVMDIFQFFTMFATDKKYRKYKIICRYQQFEGANMIVNRVIAGYPKKGLIWHFQGSGKSLLMVFAAQKLRMIPELKNPTVVIVDDRIDLETQITATFNASDIPNLTSAATKEELLSFFRGDMRKILITTIFKFGEVSGELNPRDNIIVMVDEAHRTQEGDLGEKMRMALPNAFFFGLTGTPINRVDKNTFATFGAEEDRTGYMSRYSFSDSIRDGATLPLHFEPVPVELHVDKEKLDREFEAMTDEAGLSKDEKNELSRRVNMKAIMYNPARIRKVCEHMRDHCDNTRDLAMIDLLTSTGIRVGELVKLNRSDLDFENRECIVFGKGNKQRKVYFDARTKIHLQRYLSERTDGNESLFVSLLKPYERLQISGVEIRLRKIGRELNFNKVHPHKFRRTLATMAIDKGMPIEQVQQLLGHQSIDTTLQYAMVNQNNVKESHRKYIG